eukprot:Skav233274  [mRNA]  locus=scaffold3673:17479:17679:+ [translate_table: standard]
MSLGKVISSQVLGAVVYSSTPLQPSLRRKERIFRKSSKGTLGCSFHAAMVSNMRPNNPRNKRCCGL